MRKGFRKGLALVLLLVCVFAVSKVNAAEDYRKWAQGDARWSGIRLGSSSCTIGGQGCLVTSVTKLILQSGLRSVDSFNVATLANWLNSHNGYAGNTGNLYYGKPGEMVSGFINYGTLLGYGNYSSSGYNNRIVSWVNSGYHMAIAVNGRGHWIAVDEAKTRATGQVYIMDSLRSGANADLILVDRYGTFNEIHAWKGGGTPNATPNTGGSGVTYYPACSASHVSIVSALQSIGVNSSFSNRSGIAITNGITNYSGTAAQNIHMLNLLKQGRLIRSKSTVQADTTKPVISNVRITDVSSKGYTVTCTVTDNKGVDRVQCPTWTLLNDQDDLDGNWMNSMFSRATGYNGNYSYRVNISDHNNEHGFYATHIYAWDAAGNQAVVHTGAEVTKDSQVISASNVTKTEGAGSFNLEAKLSVGNGKLSYRSSNAKVATISNNGRVTVKGVGTTTLTITASATSQYYSSNKSVTLTVKPKKSSITSLKNSTGKKMKISWKKVNSATGYQIQYARNKNFSGAATINVSKRNTTSKTVTNLTKKSNYYVRVRAYKTVSNKKYYSDWSAVRTVKIKK